MDRNQVIGFTLIGLLFAVYLYLQPAPTSQTPIGKDSVAIAQQQQKVVETQALPDSVLAKMNAEKFGPFTNAANGKGEDLVLQNQDLTLTLSTKGGAIKKIQLNKFKTFDQKDLILGDESNFQQNLTLRLASKEVNTRDLYFTPIVSEDSSSKTIRLRLAVDSANYIDQVYSLNKKEGFVVQYAIESKGLSGILSSQPLIYEWNANLPKLEYDDNKARELANVNYYQADGGFDSFTAASTDEQSVSLTTPTKWIAFKHKFFTAGFIAENAIPVAELKDRVVLADSTGIEQMNARMQLPVADIATGRGQYKMYFGPTQFGILKPVTEGFEENQELGWPIVRWINRFVVLPVFKFFSSYVASYGIIIVILVLLLRLLLLPLAYKSYMSMAKMKVLKPEMDEIKANFPDDMQKQQSEQMSLYQKFGINPLSGCIPVLLQMPILFAMFSFFPSAFELRGESFLWATDLSTYDHPIELGFTIPFYGSHVSIFTILMTVSTLVYTWYNNQMSTMQGPYKIVSYTMPVIFLFILNTLPSGLSFYYLVSNIASIAQQLIIRRFVDEGAIRAKLDENKKNYQSGTGKKTKFQSWVENAKKAQEEAQKKKK